MDLSQLSALLSSLTYYRSVRVGATTFITMGPFPSCGRFGVLRSERRCSGFTLVELLVAIAIIAVLASLVFAIGSSAREKARSNECLSNLRQLAQSVLMYAQDHDGYLPCHDNVTYQAADEGTSTISGKKDVARPDLLMEDLGPYIHSTAIRYCKSDPYAGKNVVHWEIQHQYFSYRFWEFTIPARSVGTREINIGQNEEESDRKLIGDANCYAYMRDTYKQRGEAMPGFVSEIGCEHSGGLNVVYLDGHAKWKYGAF